MTDLLTLMLELFFLALTNKNFFLGFISQKTASAANYIPCKTKDAFQRGGIIYVLTLENI